VTLEMSRTLLVLNPASGTARDAAFWLEKLRNQGIDAEVCEADADGELPPLDETDLLIVAGGDGTVHLHAKACMAAKCVLGVLPAGTGNDFARGLTIPLRAEDACRQLRTGGVQHIDVGTVNDEIFLNVAHIGFATTLTGNAGQARNHKKWWGRLAYPRLVIDRLRDLRGFKATIRDDHGTLRGRWLQITLANGRSFGGGQQVFDATPFDGQLHLIAIKPHPIHKLFFLWLWARLTRSTPKTPAVVERRSAHFEISAKSSLPVNADGEELACLPARFGIVPRALWVVAPGSMPSESARKIWLD